MSSLAARQQALVHALFGMPTRVATENIANYSIDTWARGLEVYKANAQMLAQRALSAVYPVLSRLLGDESFAALAHAYWHACPPERGDIAQWGGTLAEFVRDSDQLADEPYLPDVARAEWAMHACATLADSSPDPASFQRLMTGDLDSLWLVLAPGCHVVRSHWPLASVIAAHLDGAPSFADVGQKLAEQEAEDAIVWRSGHQPRVRQAFPGEAAFVSALLGGTALGAALTQADGLEFNTWLPMAVQSGLLLAVHSESNSI